MYSPSPAVKGAYLPVRTGILPLRSGLTGLSAAPYKFCAFSRSVFFLPSDADAPPREKTVSSPAHLQESGTGCCSLLSRPFFQSEDGKRPLSWERVEKVKLPGEGVGKSAIPHGE